MEDTQRLRFFVTYRPSFVWTAILAFLHLTMIASTFLEVRGKTYIYSDIRTLVSQTHRTVLSFLLFQMEHFSLDFGTGTLELPSFTFRHIYALTSAFCWL